MMHADPIVFTTLFAAWFTAHQLADHWGQSTHQARTKGAPGAEGRAACARHVAVLTGAKAAALGLVTAWFGLNLAPAAVTAALAVDAASHYWADRRTTLKRFAALVGQSEFYAFGAPRPGRDDNPHLGTGAYALDQSWHVGWLLIAALIASLGGGSV